MRTEFHMYGALLLRSILCAMVAQLIFSFSLGVWSAIRNTQAVRPLMSSFDAGWVTFSYAAFIGLIGCAVYGAPMYALLRYIDKASIVWVFMIGLAPGVLVLLFNIEFAVWLLVGGGTVSIMTHMLWILLFNKVAPIDRQA